MSDQSFFQFCRGLFRIIAARPRVAREVQGNPGLTMILERRSIREFKPDPISDPVWEAVLEAARLAPSTVNLQTWSFAHFTAAEWRDFFGSPLPFGAARGIVVLADSTRARRAVPEFPYAPCANSPSG